MRIGLLLLLLSIRMATCCEYVKPSVKQAVKGSKVIFLGTITQVTDSEIVFVVQRAFKGRIAARFAMPNLMMMGTPCLPGFPPLL